MGVSATRKSTRRAMRSLVVLSVLLALLVTPATLALLVTVSREEAASAWYMACTSSPVNTPSTRHGTSFITTLYSHRLTASIWSGLSHGLEKW